MAEDTEARMSFAWAGTGELEPTHIEDKIEAFVGLDGRSLMQPQALSKVAPYLAEAKTRLAEEMDRNEASLFSYVYQSELIHQNGDMVPVEHTVVVLRGNGDGLLVVGVVHACETCPILRQLTDSCRKLDSAGRRLALRLVGAIAAI
jgi:hypothetical protein